VTAASVVGIDVARLREARDRAENELLFAVTAQAVAAQSGSEGYGFENIVGVGIGERHIGGHPTGEAAVRVYVVVKDTPSALDEVARVPSAYDGVPTDVVECGELVAASNRGRFRPASSGVSVGHFEDTAGTLGFVARRDSDVVVVSNNHVFARENRANQGDAILQPGPADGGAAAQDAIAELGGFERLRFDGEPTPIDAAFARADAAVVDQQVQGLGQLDPRPLEPEEALMVRKSGRTTGVTRGHVVDRDFTARMRYRTGIVILTGQFTVKGIDLPFSEPGDSGSLVVDEQTRRPVGLVCGGSPRFTIVTPLTRVLEGLGVSFPG
jgi:hypothetical protein